MKNIRSYSPYQLTRMSDAAIRKAYSELRKVANKRLQRLEKAGLGRHGEYRFPTIAQIQSSSRATVASELADVSKFLRDERTTVKGERRFINKMSEIMTQKGYGDLFNTPEKMYETLAFLDEIRDDYKETQLPPSDILDVLQEGERLKIPKDVLKEHIDIFSAHIDELEEVKPTKGGRTFSKSRVNALLRKWK